MVKRIPYCSPSMLAALRKLEEGANPTEAIGTPLTFELLRARGWYNTRTGRITDAGRQYLKGK